MKIEPMTFAQVAPGRYRERVGMTLEEFEPGMIIEHRPGRTITETDHVLALALTGNVAPVHSDADFARSVGLDDIVVCGTVAMSIVLGASVRTTSGLTTASLGLDSASFSAPVRIGDTIYSESEVMSARASRSRPDYGIVECKVRGLNQHGEQVLSFERTFMVPRDSARVRERSNY